MSRQDAERWMKRVAKSSGMKIQDSEIYTALVSKNFLKEPQCALELGFAILMDKPIVILGFEGVEIPDNLRKVARVVEVVDPNDREGIERAMRSALKEVDQNRH